jgi:hypothetical protein
MLYYFLHIHSLLAYEITYSSRHVMLYFLTQVKFMPAYTTEYTHSCFRVIRVIIKFMQAC